MGTTATSTREAEARLVSSLEVLERDSLDTYDACIERMRDPGLSRRLEEFREQHHRRHERLLEHGRTLGLEGGGGSARSLLARGRLALADFLGDGRLLRAMGNHESDVFAVYLRAAARNDIPEPLRTLCKQARDDAERCRDWLVGAIGRSDVGRSTPRREAEIDETLDESFPASDPPSWTPVTHPGLPENDSTAEHEEGRRPPADDAEGASR